MDGYVLVASERAGGSLAGTASLFVTHDGGTTWRPSRPAKPPQWIEPGAPDDWLLAGICDAGGTCHDELEVSSDGGATWLTRAVLPPLHTPLLARQATSGWIYASGLETPSTLLHSADDGSHWSALVSPCPSIWSADLAATAGNHLWLVCGGEPSAGEQLKSVFRSSDGGVHWQMRAASGGGSTAPLGNLGSSGYVGKLAATSDQRAWLGLDRGTLLATVDGGVTWTDEAAFPPPEDFFSGLQFIDDQTGWAAVNITSDTRGNGIYRTVDGGTTWTHPPLP